MQKTRITQSVFAVLFLAVGTLCAEMEPGLWIDPARLHQVLRQQGPAQVGRNLYRTPDGWSYVMANIASGDPSWIQVGARMRPGLRGAALRQWTQAMSRALAQQPKAVLSDLTSDDLAMVCSPETEQNLSLTQEIASRRLQNLGRAVRGVGGRNLAAKRKLCLHRLAANHARLGYLFSEP